MASIFDEGVIAQARHSLNVSAEKQKQVAEASQEKKNELNPLNIDNVVHVDGDTFRFKDSERSFRVVTDPSQGIDTYESDPWAYTDAPDGQERFERHRRNYAKLTGRPEWTITRGELLERGKVQAEQTKQRMQDLGSQGLLDFRVLGPDATGNRDLLELVDRRTGQSFFADHSGREQNASYDSKYNAGQQLKDFFSGKEGEDTRFSGPRSFKNMLTDQPAIFGAGVANIVNETAQAASIIAGVNTPGVDQFFSDNRERIESFKNRFTSQERQTRDRKAQANAVRAAELFEVRKNKYIEAGDNPDEAVLKAGALEVVEGVRGLLQNPGRILDATVESLPYMIGVGAVGRATANYAAKNISKKITDDVLKAGGTPAQAGEKVSTFLASKEGQRQLKIWTTGSAVSTVAITEGLSVGAEVYDSIINLTPLEASQSEHYNALRKNEGMSHQDAVRTLAEDAFATTVPKMMALAGAASLVTGAAGFESRLFTGLIGGKAVTQATKKGVLPAVGRAAVSVSKPGLKEAAEEAIQSGGGAFLSQQAQVDAGLQDSIGSGVGTAIAEGAVIGFAAGAGAQAATGSLKKLAEANKSGTDFIQRQNLGRSNVIDAKTPKPGGMVNTVQAEIDAAKKTGNYDAGAKFSEELNAFGERVMAKPDDEGMSRGDLKDFNRVKVFYENAKAEDKVTKEQEAIFQEIDQMFTEAVTASVNEISKKKPEELTASDRAIINEAAERGVIPKVSAARLPEDAQEVIKLTNELAELRTQARELGGSGLVDQTKNKGSESVKRVFNEKFGPGIKNNKPGLDWYFNELSDIMADPNKDSKDARFVELTSRFKKFLDSQENKIAKYQRIVESGLPEGKTKFVPPKKDGTGGTANFLKKLQREQVLMKQIRQKILNKYTVWNGKDNPAIQELVKEVANDSAPETETEKPIAKAETKAPEQAPEPVATKTSTEPKAKAEKQSTKLVKQNLSDVITDNSVDSKTRVIDGLKYIAGNSKSGTYKQVAIRIINLVKNNNAEVVVLNDDDFAKKVKSLNLEKDTSALFDSGSKQIILKKSNLSKKDNEQLFLHEAIHAAVDFWLDDNQDNQRYKNLITDFANMQKTVIEWLKANPSKDNDYALSRLDSKPEEFITYGLTSAKTQEILKKIQFKSSQTVWDRFSTAIMRVLGIPLSEQTAFSALIDLSGQIFNAKEGKEVAPEVTKEPEEKADKATETKTKIGAVPKGAKVFGAPKVTAETVPEPQVTEQSETQAEAQPEPEANTATEEQKLNIQNRVEAIRRLQRKVANDSSIPIEGIVLTAKKDNARLQELLSDGTLDPIQALEQLATMIQPDPNAERIPTPKLEAEVVDQLITAATDLNKPGGSTKAMKFAQMWQDFLSGTAEMFRKVQGAFTTSSKVPEEQFANVMPGLIAGAFSRVNLPTSLKQVFKAQSSTVKSLLGSVPNLMGVLENIDARNKLYDSLNLSPAEERAMEVFRAFHKTFAEKLEATRKKVPFSESHAGKDLSQDPFSYFEMQNGLIDPNVTAALALESMLWLTGSGPQTIFNGREEINAILGRSEEHPVSRDEFRVLGTAGTLRNNVSMEIGSAAFRHLNMKWQNEKGIDPLFKDKLVASMGGHAITTMILNNQLERGTQVELEWFLAQKKENPENDVMVVGTEESRVNFIKMKETDFNESLEKALLEGHGVFDRLFGADATVKMPSFEMPTSVPSRISRSLSFIPQKMRDRMLRNAQQPWSADTNKIRVLNRFEPERFLTTAMEYVPEAELKNKHETERDALIGRNRGLMRDMKAALDWGTNVQDKPFWFTYKMIRSGRVYINSNIINPQASKLHRWLFNMSAWENEISTTPDINNPVYQNFLIAVGAGLGYDTGKLRREVVLDKVQRALDAPQTQAVLEILAQDKTEKFTPEELAIIEPFLKDKAEVIAGEKIGGEGMHTLAALTEYAKFKYATGATVKISLPMETDGITNGFIAGLLQTPPMNWGPELKEMLRAGGIYFVGDDWTNFPQWRAEGNRDNYEQIADLVSRFLTKMVGGTFATPGEKPSPMVQAIRENAARIFSSGFLPSEEELRGKEGRKWAKNPLMVVSYGSSIASVIRAITDTALESFYQQLAQANTAEEITAVIHRAYDMMEVVDQANPKHKVLKPRPTVESIAAAIAKKYDNNPKLFATSYMLSEQNTKLFETAVRETYGAALGEALNRKVGDVQQFRTQLNHANKLMNQIFAIDFDRRVVEISQLRGVTTLSPDDRRAILEQMHKEGLVPAVATAASTQNSENLETTSYHNQPIGGADGKGEAQLAALEQLIEAVYTGEEAKLDDNPPKQKSLWTRVQAPKPDSNVGVSAVVKLIHALDGVNNSEAWGTQWGVLNIHDAAVGNMNEIDTITQATNRDFFEQHRGYNLGDEILKSTVRMMTLLNPSDTRLSDQQKGKIYKDFLEHLLEFKYFEADTKIKSPKEMAEVFLAELRNNVVETNNARERLFTEIAAVNQFSKERAEHLVTGTVTTNPNQNPILHDQSLSVKEMLSVYWKAEALLNDGTVEVLGSSADSVNPALFDGKPVTMLETDKMQGIFNQLAELEQGPIDIEHQAQLNQVLNELVIPGIQSLEHTIQQVIAVDPYSTIHIGEAAGDLIRLQAAGNQLTSNADMSLQEVAIHEYLHPILKAGVTENHFIRKEVRRLFELAKANITPAMLEPEVIVGDPAIAAERAQARWDYIFNSEGDRGYHEFLAMGLTNKPLIKALKELDNRNVTYPILGQGILAAMFEVARRVLMWLGGQSKETHRGNVHNAVTAIAKATIANNQRNLQRIHDAAESAQPGYWLDKANQSLGQKIADKITDPLLRALNKRDKRLDPKNPTVVDFVKSATYVALKTREDETRKEYNRFYRELGGKKDNWFFELAQEFLPWDEQNLGTGINPGQKPGWMDLLRKSKVVVDMARENMISHTKSFLDKAFDKKNYLSQAHKQAITRVMLKTDIASLLTTMDVARVQELLNSDDLLKVELNKHRAELQTELAKQGASKLFNVFENQGNSMASLMVHGKALVENPMQNVHNVVQQYMLADHHRIPLKDPKAVMDLLDRYITLKALNITPPNDKKLALDMVNHEMARTDAGNDNGFSRLLGMQINFRELSQERLFKDNPTQMIKGYVYEIYDNDINVEYALDDPATRAEMEAKGMRWIETLRKDSLDDFTKPRAMYIGAKGLAGYNKSIVSLTNLHHRGVNLFEGMNYGPDVTKQALMDIRTRAFQASRNQFKIGYVKDGANMVPILNSLGEIVDYRYMMTEANKQKVMKKEDPFDSVLPRMFGSITDRNSTKEVNRNVVDLLWDEFDALQNSDAHRFVRVGRIGDEAGQEMWNLLPTDMQRYAKEKFGGEYFYIRDDVVNLVLGFRKLSIANSKLFGRSTPIVKMAEKIWLEIVQLARIKIATQTPRVVIGNMASNTAMLLADGIKPAYIREKGAEAISAMRLYQKDVQTADELKLRIGSDIALKRDVRALEAKLSRLEADIAANPVGQLVREGLFTSIAADVGVNDNSLRQKYLNKARDKAHKIVPGAVSTAAQEVYMLPGSESAKAAIAATQYGDFVARYIKYNYDTKVRGKPQAEAINETLAYFIYYDIPQNKYLQFMNDMGPIMFTKFFLRIQPIVAKMYTQNPVGAFGTLAVQAAFLPQPFSENIASYALGQGLGTKITAPWNVPGKIGDTLDPSEPSLLQWLLNPFGI